MVEVAVGTLAGVPRRPAALSTGILQAPGWRLVQRRVVDFMRRGTACCR
ncbi:hypothetical protein [Frankia sp. R82]|nr:hypothetical protein [Frankia sp. R82]MCM3883923.1 hypothetical protein [Frankia sp. R82]